MSNEQRKLCKKLTKWKKVTEKELKSSDEEAHMCCICLISFDAESSEEVKDSGKVVRLSECDSHFFHDQCISQCLQDSSWLQCPVCKLNEELKACSSKLLPGQITYGIRTGTQPTSNCAMKWRIDDRPVAGHEECTTLAIRYEFYDGIQSVEHPNPGQRYTGTVRNAFLPNNEEGRKCLSLLRVAWQRRLIFQVGTSVTSGRDNTVVWAGIHHKTRPNPNRGTAWSYPDPTYLNRLQEELAVKGVVDDGNLPDFESAGEISNYTR